MQALKSSRVESWTPHLFLSSIHSINTAVLYTSVPLHVHDYDSADHDNDNDDEIKSWTEC